MSRVLLVVILGVLLLLPAAADAAGSSGVVISQVYGGGGNAGATFRNDYVELFNAGSATVDLAGSTVQYATAAGTTWQATALAGTIAPGPLLPGPACIERRRRRRSSDSGCDRDEQPRRGEREDCARYGHGRAHVWGLGRELFGTRRGSRRLRRCERFRGLRFRCGAFQHHGRGSCEQRLHRHERQRRRLHGGHACATELSFPRARVCRHAFLRAERLRERRSKRGFRPHRVT